MRLQDYPSDLTMNDFAAAYGSAYGPLAKSCRFAARIRPSSQKMAQAGAFMRDLTYLCEVGELPGRAFQSMDVHYYGPNQKLPFQVQYDDLNLVFLMRAESAEREFFDWWMSTINPVNLWDFSYRDEYIATIDLFQFAEDSEDDYGPRATYKISCKNAYPLVLNPQPMTWADDGFQRLIVSFTYTHWETVADDDPYTYDVTEGTPNNIPSNRWRSNL